MTGSVHEDYDARSYDLTDEVYRSIARPILVPSDEQLLGHEPMGNSTVEQVLSLTRSLPEGLQIRELESIQEALAQEIARLNELDTQ